MDRVPRSGVFVVLDGDSSRWLDFPDRGTRPLPHDGPEYPAPRLPRHRAAYPLAQHTDVSHHTWNTLQDVALA